MVRLDGCCLGVASDELDHVDVVGGEAEHHPESRIGRGRVDVGLQEVAFHVPAHDGGQIAVVGIVTGGQLRNRRQAPPAIPARPRTVDERLARGVGQLKRRPIRSAPAATGPERVVEALPFGGRRVAQVVEEREPAAQKRKQDLTPLRESGRCRR